MVKHPVRRHASAKITVPNDTPRLSLLRLNRFTFSSGAAQVGPDFAAYWSNVDPGGPQRFPDYSVTASTAHETLPGLLATGAAFGGTARQAWGYHRLSGVRLFLD